MRRLIIILALLLLFGCTIKIEPKRNFLREALMLGIEIGYTGKEKGWDLQGTKDFIDKRMEWISE